MGLFALIRQFGRGKEGSVSILSALVLPLLIGFVSLAAEFGYGLVVKIEHQRVADLAGYAAATAYSSTKSTSTMTSVAQRVAALNGVATSAVSASLVSSPRTSSTQAVLVDVSTSNILFLAPVVNFGNSLPVDAKAYAEASGGPAACVLALSATGTGISLSGGTTVSAPACSVSSNSTVSAPCGTTITAKSISYNSTAPSQPCSGITGTISKASVPDPLTSNTGVAAASAHAATVTSLVSPSAPTVSTGADVSFDYTNSAKSAMAKVNCSANTSGGTWTVTCPAGGTYHFGSISLAGGITVNFNTAGAANITYDFSGSISNSGTALKFGPGTFNVAKGITASGGTTTTFGAGTFNIGPGTTACNGGGLYSICNAGTTMTFAGPSQFVLSAGVNNGGGSTLTLGSGVGNLMKIGKASDGNAVTIGGGAVTTFAETDANAFQMVGNFNETGGACTTFGSATQHDVYGNFSTAGGTMLGAGVYTVTGYIAIGANGGGDVTCGGTAVGVSGTGVTLVTSGNSTLSGSTCNGASFCIGAGFNNVTLSAPTSGTYANLGVVGPTSSTATGGAMLTEGASNTTLSGAFYFPNGPLTLTGGASVGNQTGQCLDLIATQVVLSGGTRASASDCFGGGSGSSSTAKLVQ